MEEGQFFYEKWKLGGVRYETTYTVRTDAFDGKPCRLGEVRKLNGRWQPSSLRDCSGREPFFPTREQAAHWLYKKAGG